MESFSIGEWFTEYEEAVYFLFLIVFLGLALISNVPSILHTPLMSGSNAISGVILLGAIVSIAELPEGDYFGISLGFIAVVLGTINIVGGFTVTDRILKMFKKIK
ncbi:MAG: NAD(P) transhydrogenase subunit alpha [Cryomorphaceae bacterium]